MKNFKYIRLLALIGIIAFQFTKSAADDFIAQKTTLPFTIDGVANETAWDSAVWYPMKYVWIPYDAHVDSSDFTGRFKLSWTSERLYLLVEIVDDSLSDMYPEPLNNYYNDDCVEVFLDEDKSGGLHNSGAGVNPFNAFAMHVSTLFDVVDNGNSGTALFNDLITTNLTKNDSLYTWELEIKVYPDTYNPASPGDPETLTPNKLMGFSLAYCDNDGGSTRENFLASTYVTPADYNNSWLDASIFGSLKLVDSSYTAPSSINIKNEITPFNIFPNPAKDIINITFAEGVEMPETIRLVNLMGQVIYSQKMNDNEESGSLAVGDIDRGVYLIEIVKSDQTSAQQVILY